MPEPWHEQEELWRHVAPVIFRSQRRERAPEEVEQVLALAGPPAGAAVLDLPCGVGRHAVELARRGFRVTGVDRTQSYLDEGARRAAEAGVELEWLCADMRAFRRPEAFDLALNLYTSFGYFETRAEDRLVAENFAASLRPGGRLVMETASKEILAARFVKRDWVELDDGTLLLEERTVEDAWRRLRMRWIIFREGERREHEILLRHYSAAELIDLLQSVGFSGVEAYGGLDGSPYDQNARRLVVVAKR